MAGWLVWFVQWELSFTLLWQVFVMALLACSPPLICVLVLHTVLDVAGRRMSRQDCFWLSFGQGRPSVC